MSKGIWAEVKPETRARRDQLAATAERRHRVQDLARGYLAQTSIPLADFARRVGYGYSTVRKFLADRYEHVGSTDSLICNAIMDFLETYPIGSEESAEKLYEIGNVATVRKLLLQALEMPRIYMLYAPPGSGKTSVVKNLIAAHNRRQASSDRQQHIFQVYCRADIRPRDLMRRIANACGTPAAGEIDRILRNLQWTYRDARVVLVFDEAQHLSVTCMETVRELFDQAPRMSLIFTGSHELDRIFTTFAGTLEQLERRVTDKIALPPVTRDEAALILRRELGDLLPTLNGATIQKQIEFATVQVRVKGQPQQRYISIGRLMCAIREIQQQLAASETDGASGAEEVRAS